MGGSIITKSLALLYLLSSAEVFTAARKLDTNVKPVHQQHQSNCLHEMVNGEEPSSALAKLTQGLWGCRSSGACSAAGTCSDGNGNGNGSGNTKHPHAHSTTKHILKRRGGHGGHSHSHTHTGGDLTTFGIPLPFFKILLQLLLTGLNVACWLVPMKIKKFRENQDLISLANAFSGGVFLSLAFGHMIPHSVEGFDIAGYAHNVPFLVTLTGYLLIFFVEKIAFDTHSFIEEHHHHGHSHAAPAATEKKNGGKGGANGSAAAVAPASPMSASGRSAVVLLFALGVHSIFETMALGLSDTPLQSGLLATSIALHQPAESIALLVSFLKSGLSEAQTTKYLSFFSGVGMLGVLLGLAVNTLAADIWDSVFVALAAGTFIYVGCTEIVAEEFEEPEGKWKKFGALLAGVVIVGAITAVTEGWAHG